MVSAPDFTAPADVGLSALLDDLEDHFSHELALMQGNYGLTGDEDAEEMTVTGQIAEWQDVRNALAFLERIRQQKASSVV